jgi:hypothetical protein
VVTKGVIAEIHALLGPLGFEKSEGIWNRRHGELVDVIRVQVSKAGNRVTIEAGVLHPVAFTNVWEEPVPPFVDTPECTIRARIGDLVDGHDRWWSLEDRDLVGQLTAAIQSHFVPFLERHHTAEAIESWLATSREVRNLMRPILRIWLHSSMREGITKALAHFLQNSRGRRSAIGSRGPPEFVSD